MKTWDSVEPEFQHLVFDEVSARNFIDENFGAAAVDAYDACRVPAMKADFFRYCALFARGGLYVDADSQYKGGLAWLYSELDRGLLLKRGERTIPNGFMAVRRAADPLMAYAMQTVMRNIAEGISNNVWEVTGPGIITSLFGSKSGARDFLLNGFRFVDIAEMRKFFVFINLEYKAGAEDWRVFKAEGRSIFVEDAQQKLRARGLA